MSTTSESGSEIENLSQYKTHSQKPKHVKRLNFGEAILNSNTVDKSKGPDADKFIIDEKVEGIPRTDKEDLVRNWVEIHNNDDDLSNKESTQPTVLSVSISKSLLRPPPIFGIYQNNIQLESDYNIRKHEKCFEQEMFPVLINSERFYNSERMNRKRSNSSDEEEQTKLHIENDINVNKDILVNNSEDNSSQNVIVNKSPVLVRDAYYYKRRHKRFITKNVQMDNAAIIETDDCINRNMNLLPPNTWQNLNSLSPEISMSAAKQRKIDSDEDNQDKEIYASKNIVPTFLNSAVIENDTIIKNSSIDKNTLNTWQNCNSPSPEFTTSATKQRKIDCVKDERVKEIYVSENMISPTFSNSSVIEDDVFIDKNTIEEDSSVIESVSSDNSNIKEETNTKDSTSDGERILKFLKKDTEDGQIMISSTSSSNYDLRSSISESNSSISESSSSFYKSNSCISESNTALDTSYEVIDKWSIQSSSEDSESNKKTFPYKIKTIWAIASLKDSNETFYSQAESIKSESSIIQNDHALEDISQVTTFSNESVDNKSNQTNCFISTATSPAKTSSNPTMSLQILDSCKKQRRTKKKSLTAKLQSLVNRQTSFVRIWQHQIKQTDVDGTLIPHVDVYVDKCTTHLHRQFLEGIVLNDSFNLLNNNDNQEKSNIDESSYKAITMIIVPDIVGKIEMKFESVVKIYPPWDIMDKSKSVLNITYIKTVSNMQRKAILNEIKIPERRKEKVLVEESHCLCLEAKKILPSCKERSNDKRVDVMTIINKF